MRTRSFSRRSSRSQSPRRNREWFAGSTSPSGNLGEPGRILLTTTNAFSSWIITPSDMLDFYDEPTLVRSLICDQGHALAPNASASISVSWYVGISLAKGDNATPPFLDPQDGGHDWIYWAQWMAFNGGTSDGFINAGPTRNGNDTIDIKSKRKFQTGAGLAVYAIAPLNNSHDVVWAMNSRHLFLNN